ncbi:hypothetical protein N9B23_02410 [bacterium]|nr:hypothetical protein [bacterium]
MPGRNFSPFVCYAPVGTLLLPHNAAIWIDSLVFLYCRIGGVCAG